MRATCRPPAWERTRRAFLYGLLLSLLAMALPVFAECGHDHAEAAAEQAMTCCGCHIPAMPPVAASPTVEPNARSPVTTGPVFDTGVSVQTAPFEPPRA